MEEERDNFKIGDVMILDHGDGCTTLARLFRKTESNCCWNKTEIYAENIVDVILISGGCPHYSLPSSYRSGHNGSTRGEHEHIAHIALNVYKQPLDIWI